MSSNISDIVSTMAKTGCTAEQIAAVVEVLESKNEERRAKDRERKRVQRSQVTENKRNMSQDVTRTSADTEKEKRKKEPKKEKTNSPSKENPPTGVKRKVSSRGSRLPEDWILPIDWGEWAEKQSMTPDDVMAEEEKFRDYWHSRAGPNGVKLDWFAVWRNWVRRSMEYKNDK